MTLTNILFSITPLAVAPPLTFPLLPSLSPFLAPGRCFRTWVLITDQVFYLSLPLWSFAPTSVPLFSILRRLAGMTLLLTLTLAVLQHRNTRPFLSSAFFTSLALNAAKSCISFGCIKCYPKAWWSTEVEEAVSERRKAFTAAHRSDEDRQAYISASRRALSVIAKAKAGQGRRHALLSPPHLTLNLYTLFFALLLALLPHLPTSPTVPLQGNRLRALVFVNYLRSHFSVSQPKALRSRATGYLSELRRATCPKSLTCQLLPILPS